MTNMGTLIIEAAKKAKTKASKAHTAKAECGCQVTVGYFSEKSHSVDMVRCAEHEIPRTKKRTKR